VALPLLLIMRGVMPPAGYPSGDGFREHTLRLARTFFFVKKKKKKKKKQLKKTAAGKKLKRRRYGVVCTLWGPVCGCSVALRLQEPQERGGN